MLEICPRAKQAVSSARQSHVVSLLLRDPHRQTSVVLHPLPRARLFSARRCTWKRRWQVASLQLLNSLRNIRKWLSRNLCGFRHWPVVGPVRLCRYRVRGLRSIDDSNRHLLVRHYLLRQIWQVSQSPVHVDALPGHGRTVKC
jgi:hypothetical protein